MKQLYILFGVIILLTPLKARDHSETTHVITDVNSMSLKVHHAANIAMSVTNYGQLGSSGGFLNDPEIDPPTPAPSMEFPKNSEINYLCFGFIWIGATVLDSVNSDELDTLVSIGDDGWWYGIMELVPQGEFGESLYRQRTTADEEIIARFADTTTYRVGIDPLDNRPHIPLGLEITQQSKCWSTPGYNEFILIDYTLENISNHDLNDTWVGLYFEGDAWHISEDTYAPEEGAQDDITGYVEHNGHGIAWLADNNGQPYGGAFNDSSVTDVVGIMMVDASSPDVRTNYNWWISDIHSDYDWGPQRQENYHGPYPGGGNGTPGGDIAKYRVMSNGEHDYDQAYCALDWTDEGWIACRLEDPVEVADGHDTRYLISWGPFDIPQGESATLTIAVIAGHDFHTMPDNYDTYLNDLADDSVSVANFYANLNFSDLLSKADTVLAYYNNPERIPIGYPDDFKINNWSDTLITLLWSGVHHPEFDHFNFYRGTEPGVYDTEISVSDSMYRDTDIINNTEYYYTISCVNSSQVEGVTSSELVINSGTPQLPRGLDIRSVNDLIELSWLANTDDDLAGYNIYRRSQYDPEDNFSFIDFTENANYTDDYFVNGWRYYYYIKAVDTYGNESPASDIVSIVVVASGNSILLVNANWDNEQFNPDYDLMASFYYSLFDNSDYQVTVIERPPVNIVELAHFATLIWCHDLPISAHNFNTDVDLISQYLDAGGNLILFGPKMLVPSHQYGEVLFNHHDFAYNYLKLQGLTYPLITTHEFIGASSLSPPLPDISLDTTKTNRIVFPEGDNDGRLFGMGIFSPRYDQDVIYNFSAVYPETSSYDGLPVGVIHSDYNFTIAYCDFPLYYLTGGQANVIVHEILNRFEQVGIDEEADAERPLNTSLIYNYPNPFNNKTNIVFEISSQADVTLSIYDILGRQLDLRILGKYAPGRHTYTWDPGDLPSGIYFYKISSGSHVALHKCLLLK